MKREQQKHAGIQRQGTFIGRPPKVPDPTLDVELGHPGAGGFKSKSFHEQEHPVSIRVKIRVPETGAGASKSKSFHEQDHPVSIRRPPPFSP